MLCQIDTSFCSSKFVNGAIVENKQEMSQHQAQLAISKMAAGSCVCVCVSDILFLRSGCVIALDS